MAKAYWVVTYRSISDPDSLANYAKLAAPAMAEMGGRYIARGNPTEIHEAGLNQRVVLIEFDSLDKAIAAHDTPAYKAALDAFGTCAVRDIRIVEGV